MMKSVGDGESWTTGHESDPCRNPVDHHREHERSQQRQQQDSPRVAADDVNASTQPMNSAPSSLHDISLRTSPLKPVRSRRVCACCGFHLLNL
jgi:hypothetical protein